MTNDNIQIPFRIEFYPGTLAQNDNQVEMIIWNGSEDLCQQLVCRLNGDGNLWVDSAPAVHCLSLMPGDKARIQLQLTALNPGTATLGVRLSWKQQEKAHYHDLTFTFQVSESYGDQTTGRKGVREDNLHLRDYYFNNLPKWRESLLKWTKNQHHLEEQKALHGGIDVPLRIINELEIVELEIEKLKERITKAQIYLARSDPRSDL